MRLRNLSLSNEACLNGKIFQAAGNLDGHSSLQTNTKLAVAWGPSVSAPEAETSCLLPASIGSLSR
jgi:hypothetical protein